MSNLLRSRVALAAGVGVVAGVAAVHAYKYIMSSSDSCCSSSSSSSSSPAAFAKKPVVVTVSGAGGQIGYSIIFQIASGRMLGPDQPIELRLLEIPPVLNVVRGVMMELEDCAFPLITKVTATSDANEAFQGTEVALLIGGRPRGPGMSRADLLKFNAKIFKEQGAALDAHASRNVKVLVVANPANTNALIAHLNAPSLPATAFSAMTRLDQNRAVAQLAKRLGVSPADIRNVIVWGNHSSTQYPDVSHASVFDKRQGRYVKIEEVLGGASGLEYLHSEFISSVQKRGAAIIDVLGKSSAASAANAAVEHVRDWVMGTKEGEFVSMGIVSDGSYGVAKGLVYSFPVRTKKGGEYEIVQGLEVSEFSREKLSATEKELEEEKADATAN